MAAAVGARETHRLDGGASPRLVFRSSTLVERPFCPLPFKKLGRGIGLPDASPKFLSEAEFV